MDRHQRRQFESAAEDAFKFEVKARILRPILQRAEAEIKKIMVGISNGDFPSEGAEYVVMRYRPLTAGHDEFLEQVVREYIDWARKLNKLIDD